MWYAIVDSDLGDDRGMKRFDDAAACHFLIPGRVLRGGPQTG